MYQLALSCLVYQGMNLVRILYLLKTLLERGNLPNFNLTTALTLMIFRAITVQVKVLDTPARPEGPIEVSGLTAEKCTIRWSCPAKNGGSEITNYIVEKRETSRLSWILVDANIQGTICKISKCDHFPMSLLYSNMFTPDKLIDGNNYIFRVRAENKYGIGQPLETEEILAKNMFTLPSSPASINIQSVSNNSVTLSWERPKNDGGATIAGYIVHKRQRQGVRWNR